MTQRGSRSTTLNARTVREGARRWGRAVGAELSTGPPLPSATPPASHWLNAERPWSRGFPALAGGARSALFARGRRRCHPRGAPAISRGLRARPALPGQPEPG